MKTLIQRHPQHRTNPPGRWLCVAIGDEGDCLYWKEGYEVFEKLCANLCRLEEFGEDKAALKEDLAGLPVFAELLDGSFPPLYHESDFNFVQHMRCDRQLGWREHRWVGFSAAEVKIFIWSTRRKKVLSQARILAGRLDLTLALLEAEKKNARRARKRTR